MLVQGPSGTAAEAAAERERERRGRTPRRVARPPRGAAPGFARRRTAQHGKRDQSAFTARNRRRGGRNPCERLGLARQLSLACCAVLAHNNAEKAPLTALSFYWAVVLRTVLPRALGQARTDVTCSLQSPSVPVGTEASRSSHASCQLLLAWDNSFLGYRATSREMSFRDGEI
ncbi:hypothetical protein HPB50_018516 [Hyalomma asiaticum]|uniref:Uncharacterized protein n=1 Tax=Hyalomma asiaticum TaxID=266040 RepID=A0ACB7TK71_HYAAI|nr:hypothetical protein HPB50_018516 [Hyalomma asiaticum]